MNSKYDWQRVNPHMFYGRSEIRGTVKNGLLNGRSYAIAGGRRMGKSTLLRRIEIDLNDESSELLNGKFSVVTCYIDGTQLGQVASTVDFLCLLSTSLYVSPNGRIQHASAKPKRVRGPADFAESLKRILTGDGLSRVQVVFLFDEVEPILRHQWAMSFFAFWRSLLNNTPGISEQISSVFTGSTELSQLSRDIGSPLSNILIWRQLEVLSASETMSLITEPTGWSHEESAVSEIVTLTGGHPFLAQYLMKTVVEDGLQTPKDAAKRFLDEQRTVFESWWQSFDEIGRFHYAKLAATVIGNQLLSRAPEISDLGRSSEVLLNTGVAQRGADGEISVCGTMFLEWYRANGHISITPVLSGRVDENLKRVERQIRRTYLYYLEKNKKPHDWLQQELMKRQPQLWKEVIKRGRFEIDIAVPNNEVVKCLDLGTMFDLVLESAAWSFFRDNMGSLGPDRNKRKLRFEERKDHLVFVRNQLRHVNEDRLTPDDLIKADVFCNELFSDFSSMTS